MFVFLLEHDSWLKSGGRFLWPTLYTHFENQFKFNTVRLCEPRVIA